MSRRLVALTVSSLVAVGALSAAATAAGPPPPKAANGATVTLVASGLGTPTSFAFGAGQVFEGDGGSQQAATPVGGVYLLKNGTATLLAGSPKVVFGLTWHNKTLYVSAGNKLLAWSKWNGTKFASQKTLYTAPKKFSGFNGLAFGPDGRLYVGVDLGATNDHGPASLSPHLYDILSFNSSGKNLKVYATGIRQPWQLAFAKGSSTPFVSDLGQDSPSGINPPDFLLKVKPGDNYGFPKCNWLKKSACKKFTKPYKFLAPHTDPGGLAIIGKTLYMSEFGFATVPPQVVAMPVKGGTATPYLTGFVAPIIGLGTDGKSLYVGELTGQVFKVTP